MTATIRAHGSHRTAAAAVVAEATAARASASREGGLGGEEMVLMVAAGVHRMTLPSDWETR